MGQAIGTHPIWNIPGAVISFFQKRFRFDSGLFQYRAKRAFRHVARVIGYRGVTPARPVKPDLVAPSGLAVELEAQLLQSSHDVPVAEAAQPPH